MVGSDGSGIRAAAKALLIGWGRGRQGADSCPTIPHMRGHSAFVTGFWPVKFEIQGKHDIQKGRENVTYWLKSNTKKHARHADSDQTSLSVTFSGTFFILYDFIKYFKKDNPSFLPRSDFLEIIDTIFGSQWPVSQLEKDAIIFQVKTVKYSYIPA
jgi:hypothetical protein